MLDISQFQKPARKMKFHGIRSSKFRHVYGKPAKKEKCFENLRITRNAQDVNYCAVNPKFLAVVVDCRSSSFCFCSNWLQCVEGDGSCRPRTGCQVEPFQWQHHSKWQWGLDDQSLAYPRWRSQEWPEGLHDEAERPQVGGHGVVNVRWYCSFLRRKVGIIEWHPTAENILASAGFDHLVIIWNITNSVPVNIFSCHVDTIFSISFNRLPWHLGK